METHWRGGELSSEEVKILYSGKTDGNTKVIQPFASDSTHSNQKLELYEVEKEMEKNENGNLLSSTVRSFNSEIKTDKSGYEDVMGKHGTGERNDRGEQLNLEVCTMNKMCTANTYFQHRISQKPTW